MDEFKDDRPQAPDSPQGYSNNIAHEQLSAMRSMHNGSSRSSVADQWWPCAEVIHHGGSVVSGQHFEVGDSLHHMFGPHFNRAQPSEGGTGQSTLTNEDYELESSYEVAQESGGPDTFMHNANDHPPSLLNAMDVEHLGAQLGSGVFEDLVAYRPVLSPLYPTSPTVVDEACLGTGRWSLSIQSSPTASLHNNELVEPPEARGALFREPRSGGMVVSNDEHSPPDDKNSVALDHRCPTILVSNPFGHIKIPEANDLYAMLLDGESVAPSIFLQQACEFVHAINTVWMQRLAPTPDLYMQCSAWSTRVLFETGTQALQRCFVHILPRSFEDLFALVHVALAFSLVLNKEGSPLHWEELLSDLYLWGHALASTEETSTFARVLNRMWCSQTSSQILCSETDSLNARSSKLGPTISIFSSAQSLGTDLSIPGLSSDPIDDLSPDCNQPELLNMLMQRTVIQECCKFLDAFEFVSMSDKHDPAFAPYIFEGAQTVYIQGLQALVTGPLQQLYPTGTLNEHVYKIENDLRHGLLCGVRELEIALIFCNRIPTQVKTSFLNDVGTRCDMAVEPPNTCWRNEFYALDLGSMSYMFMELERSPGFTSRLSSQIPIAGAFSSEASRTLSNYTSDSLLFSAIAPATTHSISSPPLERFPNPSYLHLPLRVNIPRYSSPDHQWNLSIDSAASSVTSNDFMSVDSPSSPQSAAAAFLEPTTGITRCEHCPDKVFRGKAESQRRSMRRHQYEEHSVSPRLSCTVHRCRATFRPGRTDNLKRHMEQKHPMELLSVSLRPRSRRATT